MFLPKLPIRLKQSLKLETFLLITDFQRPICGQHFKLRPLDLPFSDLAGRDLFNRTRNRRLRIRNRRIVRIFANRRSQERSIRCQFR